MIFLQEYYHDIMATLRQLYSDYYAEIAQITKIESEIAKLEQSLQAHKELKEQITEDIRNISHIFVPDNSAHEDIKQDNKRYV
jgi:hypothetical protein